MTTSRSMKWSIPYICLFPLPATYLHITQVLPENISQSWLPHCSPSSVYPDHHWQSPVRAEVGTVDIEDQPVLSALLGRPRPDLNTVSLRPTERREVTHLNALNWMKVMFFTHFFTPAQLSTGSGLRNRRGPTGGLAKGIPLKLWKTRPAVLRQSSPCILPGNRDPQKVSNISLNTEYSTAGYGDHWPWSSAFKQNLSHQIQDGESQGYVEQQHHQTGPS